ncbi:MAG TPA: class IIb bacteriocin, lactobin A/cerein 7B family [Paludibacteraceae bacterium]|nr:class IIb bacteriocin, lactobin A/cerein 7B family [Paludibacteraceae bacterium]HOH75410.1 class IIb bacteriocin, lactobin A/cerein 7B family [Paludibacteraceae bacterium]
MVVSNNFYNFKNMKSFDLNSYGVQEISVQEMKEVGGGIGVFAVAIVGLAVLYVAGTVIGLYNGHKFGGMP